LNINTMNNSTAPAQMGNTDFGFDNFDPETIQSPDTINVVFVIDTSSSVANYSDVMETAFNNMKNNLKTSHVKDQLFFSKIIFNSDIVSQTGFQPIVSVDDVQLNCMGSTALYRSTKVGLQNAISYRKALENNGINCKTLVFVITDGEDMEGGRGMTAAAEVKAMIGELLAEERNFASFTSIMFGVGDRPALFEEAQRQMGIQQLALISAAPEDVRKMINFISSSISSTAAGVPVSTANF